MLAYIYPLGQDAVPAKVIQRYKTYGALKRYYLSKLSPGIYRIYTFAPTLQTHTYERIA